MASEERPEVATKAPTLMTSAQILRDVAAELEEAQSQHAGMNSAHEAYAVILEELEEFWAEVKKPRRARRPAAMYIELVQVAAMAVRAILDLQPEVGDVR